MRVVPPRSAAIAGKSNGVFPWSLVCVAPAAPVAASRVLSSNDRRGDEMPGRGRAPSYWRRVKSLLLIGHLPDLRDAALRLATSDSDYDAVMALADGCPTSRLAVREAPGTWAGPDGADAHLRGLHGAAVLVRRPMSHDRSQGRVTGGTAGAGRVLRMTRSALERVAGPASGPAGRHGRGCPSTGRAPSSITPRTQPRGRGS